MRNEHAGFSLIETLIGIALLSTLLSIATPSLQKQLRTWRLRTISWELVHSFTAARHMAIQQQQSVLIAANNGQWQQGWRVAIDSNNNGIIEDNEPLLRQMNSLSSGIQLTGNNPVSRMVRYTQHGNTETLSGAFQAGTLTLCYPNSDLPTRKLVLSATGRFRVEVDNSGGC